MGRSAASPKALLVGLGVALLIAAGCTTAVSGSGTVTTMPVAVSGFSKLEVSNSFDVNLSFGDTQSVTLRLDDNLVGHLDVGVSDGTLHLGLEPGTSVRDAKLHADVTARSLSSIGLSGASRLQLSGDLTGDGVDVTMSGASGLDGTVRVDQANVELSGASNAKLEGSARRVQVTESGASLLDAALLEVTALTIDLSGASTAQVSVSGTISAVASGASTLRYRGSPTFTRRDVSGGSSIEAA